MPKLLNNNTYSTWAFLVKVNLIKKFLLEALDGQPRPMNTFELNEIRNMALLVIPEAAVTDDIGLDGETLTDLIEMRLAKGGDLQQHLKKMCVLIDFLKSKGLNFHDHFWIILLLQSLNQDYAAFMKNIFAGSEEDFTLEEVKTKLLLEENWTPVNRKGS